MVKATSHDNRGDEDVAYGFVYFNDGKRVAYATGHGVTGATGNWPAISDSHIREAQRYLKEEAGIKL